MSGFVLHPDALTDLTEIWEYIAADSPSAADSDSLRPGRKTSPCRGCTPRSPQSPRYRSPFAYERIDYRIECWAAAVAA